MEHIKILEAILKPYTCTDKIRVGSTFDGGYILPEKSIGYCSVLLSFGISTNIEFEQEMVKLNPAMNIYLYDPFIGVFADLKRLLLRITGKKTAVHRDIRLPLDPAFKKPPGLLSDIITRFFHWCTFYRFIAGKNIHFHKTGLRDYNDRMFTTITEIFSNPAINTEKNIIIKMDIEGDEYSVYKQMPAYLQQLNVILLEVHEVTDHIEELTDMIMVFKSGGLLLFHVHGNNSDVLVENTTIPNTLELSFARAPYIEPLYDNALYPDEKLDSPTNPSYLDYGLGFLKTTHA